MNHDGPHSQERDSAHELDAARRAREDDAGHDEAVPVPQGPPFDLPASEELEGAAPELSAPPPLSPAHAALADLSKEELIDRHLRLVSDHRRFRQRADEERLEARRDERERVLLSLLDVLDTVERGLDASEGEDNPWREGMLGIRKQMLDVLGRYGVTPFTPLGAPFDAHEQEALSTMPDESKPDGAVGYVERNGYRHGERVLRPARVVVVKNG